MRPTRLAATAWLALPLCSLAAVGCGESVGATHATPSTSGAASTANAVGESRCNEAGYVTVLDVDGTTPGTAIASLVAGADGGAWAAGQLVGTANFGGTPFAARGGADAFVARLDRCGRVQWARAYGGAGDETALDLAADAEGNAYLLGTFNGTVDFGTGPVAGEGPGRDAFLLKLDPGGDVVWWKHLDTLDGGAYVADLSVDSAGNVLLLGHLEGELSLGDAAVESPTITGFAAKIGPTAQTVWARRLGTAADWEPLEIEATDDGGAVVAGEDARGVGLFALRVTAGGDVAWTKSFRAAGQFDEQFFGLTLGPGDEPVLVGRGFFAQGVPPDGDAPPHFVAALGEGGAPTWVDFRAEHAGRVDRDPLGGFVVAGYACDGAGSPEPAGCAVTVSSLAPGGAELGSKPLRGDATVQALDVEASGARLLAGAFDGGLRVGAAQATGSGGDLYVARSRRLT